MHMPGDMIGERNAENYKELQSTVQYIKRYFEEAGMVTRSELVGPMGILETGLSRCDGN
jgi:hypothetical protein